MAKYKIEADLQVERWVEAEDPDDALSKFFDTLDEAGLFEYEYNKYKVYEL